MKEDIYERMIDVKNNSSITYIPPALRQKLNSSDNNSITEQKRHPQGQLNRLSVENLSSILNEIEPFHRSQSRASINLCLYQLYYFSLHANMYEDYFCIDDILSTQERIRCQLLVDIPKLGFLECSSSNDEKKEAETNSSLLMNTKLELPYWMVYSICNCKTRFASLPELPLIYSRIQRQIFAADASVVDLAKQGPHFYRQGQHLLELNFNEKRQVAITLLQTYQQRFRSIMDSAFHLVLSNDHHHHENMKQKIAKFERQEKILLLLGQAAFRDYDRLINNETKQMLPPKIQGITNDLTNVLTAANNKRKR